MKKFLSAAAFFGAAYAMSTTPVFALEVSFEDSLCPMEAIGEAELDSWAATLVASKGQMSDAQTAKLSESVNTCAKDLGWSRDDTVSALEFNLSIIAGSAIGDNLTAGGIDAESYESVLENRTAEDLQQILSDPENSPALKELTEKMVADFGDKLTDEITADLATYIAFMAQSQLSAMKMIGGGV